MATYKELQDQIAALQNTAELTRAQELDGAVQQIKELMAEYGITLEDLSTSTKKKGGTSKTKASAQFQDADGNTWSGRGRIPSWLKSKDKENFRI
ncbi:MAG: H-NS histone family protein [Pedobacter sp.]|nr:MAG: H-NS histone family protein [Pedobacter sp.]